MLLEVEIHRVVVVEEDDELSGIDEMDNVPLCLLHNLHFSSEFL